jgi:hypothetical protein
MATKTTPKTIKRKKPVAKKKPIKKVSIFSKLNGKRTTPLIAIALFALVGAYFVFFSSALTPDEVLLNDQPERGLVYNGQKVKNKGPCKDGFDLTTPAETKSHGNAFHNCTHIDPGPEGFDIRERAKNVDKELQDLAKADEIVKPLATDDPSDIQQVSAATISGSSMAGTGSRDWPCKGTGNDGQRVSLVYVYAQGNANRLSDLRPGFVSIAKHMNYAMWKSGYDSGNAHQIRFETTSSCALVIRAVAIPGSSMQTYAEVSAALKAAGYTGNNRKYLAWVDYHYSTSTINSTTNTPCGQGNLYVDSRPTWDNYNNTLTGISLAWKGCWNYAEPHELMHNLGAVQYGAPYSTPGYHCRDERDIMCYKDSSTVNIVHRCDRAIDFWLYDCGHDTYYRGNSPASGWLSNHWNIANSGFVTN